jgi:plasmid maintenance system killer protein
MKTPILPFFTVLFLICGLIYLSWSFPGNSDGKSLAVLNNGQESAADQDSQPFMKTENPESYSLEYGWRDFDGKSHKLAFDLSRAQLQQAESEFGYYPEDLRKYLDDHLEVSRERMVQDLRKFTQEMIDKSKYSEYISIVEATSKSFDLKLSAPSGLHKKVKGEFEKIRTKLAKEQAKLLKKIEKSQEEEKMRFLESKGIRKFSGKLGVDYSLCVKNNQARVRHILEIMRDENKDLSLRHFLGLLLSFIQEIRYYVPPFSEKGKIIMEFWVPPRVLVENFGDCDSNGVTFAALWKNFKKYPLLLIRIPKHFLVGLAIPPISEQYLVLKGLRYTLCEVSVPEKLPPGMIGRYSQICLQNGQFVYDLIR